MPFFSRWSRSVSPSVATLRITLRRGVHLAELPRPAIGADDAAALHHVDEAAGAREADGHLALQHRHGRLALIGDDLHRLLVAVVLGLVAAVHLAPRETVRPLDHLVVAVVADAGLRGPVVADRGDLVV